MLCTLCCGTWRYFIENNITTRESRASTIIACCRPRRQVQPTVYRAAAYGSGFRHPLPRRSKIAVCHCLWGSTATTRQLDTNAQRKNEGLSSQQLLSRRRCRLYTRTQYYIKAARRGTDQAHRSQKAVPKQLRGVPADPPRMETQNESLCIRRRPRNDGIQRSKTGQK